VCPDGIDDKDVVITDVAYKNDIILEIIARAKSVLFIDHHITIIDDIKKIEADNFKIIYDVNECGSSLSWKYCAELTNQIKLHKPYVFKLIKDNDIGLWKNKDTKPFITAVRFHFDISSSAHKNLLKFDLLLNDAEVQKIIKIGKDYMVYKNYLIKEIIYGHAVKKLRFKSKQYNVAVINNRSSTLNSEIATETAKLPHIDFCIIWYYNHKKKVFVLSFRSTKVNVGEIAKSFGGGGHKLASSCTLTTFIDNIFEK
jgi:nanoRNase/pAp phosphatase (c-di-AMP/oligoRNAs hydrolase)